MKNARWGRREFLQAAAKGVAGGVLVGGCDSKTETPSAAALVAPGASPGPLSPNDGPEVRDLKFGMIVLTDCSPIVIAHEKGLFKKYDINSTVSKGASWAAIRDALSNGDIQATHMLTGMPIASTMGLSTSHVGNETDLHARLNLGAYVSLWAGWSHVFAGPYIRQTQTTGTSRDMDWVFVQMTVDF